MAFCHRRRISFASTGPGYFMALLFSNWLTFIKPSEVEEHACINNIKDMKVIIERYFFIYSPDKNRIYLNKSIRAGNCNVNSIGGLLRNSGPLEGYWFL